MVAALSSFLFAQYVFPGAIISFSLFWGLCVAPVSRENAAQAKIEFHSQSSHQSRCDALPFAWNPNSNYICAWWREPENLLVMEFIRSARFARRRPARSRRYGGTNRAGNLVAGAELRTSFIIDTMEYLYKGGRCSALQMFAGSLLKIRPVIEIKPDGSMGVKDKARGARGCKRCWRISKRSFPTSTRSGCVFPIRVVMKMRNSWRRKYPVCFHLLRCALLSRAALSPATAGRAPWGLNSC
jgi:hypothetical protein